MEDIPVRARKPVHIELTPEEKAELKGLLERAAVNGVVPFWDYIAICTEYVNRKNRSRC